MSESGVPFAEERAARLTLGASDAASVLNCSPFGNPYTVFAQKVYGLGREPNQAMEWGKRLEGIIAGFYSDLYGMALTGTGEETHVSLSHPWMHATPDRWRSDGKLVEIKLASSARDWGPNGSDQVPPHVGIQCQHQMLVLDVDDMDVAALLSGTEFRTYHLKRNAEAGLEIASAEKYFYEEFIEKKVAPPIDYRHPATQAVLQRLYGVDTSHGLDAPPEWGERIKVYAELKALSRHYDKAADAVKAEIQDYMGDAWALFGRGPYESYAAIRKEVRRREYTVQPTTYVNFRVKTPDNEE